MSQTTWAYAALFFPPSPSSSNHSHLQVMRIGPSHQAGSDSLLTASTFFKMREIYFNDTIDDAEYSGKLYGLGQTFAVSNGVASDSVRGERGDDRRARRSERGDGAAARRYAEFGGGDGGGVSQLWWAYGWERAVYEDTDRGGRQVGPAERARPCFLSFVVFLFLCLLCRTAVGSSAVSLCM